MHARAIAIGDPFGHWSVIGDRKWHAAWGAYVFPCRCRCGHEQELPRMTLLNGRSTQCRTCADRERRRGSILLATPDGPTMFDSAAVTCQRWGMTRSQFDTLYNSKRIPGVITHDGVRYVPADAEWPARVKRRTIRPATQAVRDALRVMRRHGMSHADAAKEIGVAPLTLSNWICGANKPATHNAEKLRRWIDRYEMADRDDSL